MTIVTFEEYGTTVGPFEDVNAAFAWLQTLSPERSAGGLIASINDPASVKALWELWDEEVTCGASSKVS